MKLDPTQQRQFWGLFVLAALIFVMALGVAILLFVFGGPMEDLSPPALVRIIRSWGAWGVIGSIGLMALHSFVPFPSEFLAVANGMVYGPVGGIAVTWLGAMLGAWVAFGVARTLGRPFVQLVVARRRWQGVDDWLAKHGGRSLLAARLIPIVAFNLISYAAGLTPISWWTFTWATALGILPLTVLLVVVGDRLLAWDFWGALTAIVGVTLFVAWGWWLRRGARF